LFSTLSQLESIFQPAISTTRYERGKETCATALRVFDFDSSIWVDFGSFSILYGINREVDLYAFLGAHFELSCRPERQRIPEPITAPVTRTACIECRDMNGEAVASAVAGTLAQDSRHHELRISDLIEMD
jgi:hypothetical protein